MATTRKPRSRATNPAQKLAIDDTPPPRKPSAPKPKPITLAEALAEQAAEEGKTVEQVQAELKAPEPDAPKAERQPGTSNLASTIRNHRANYQVALHPNGKKTQNNGDLVAQTLLRIPFEDLKAFGQARLGKTYDTLNPGHQRMCLGNLIRGALKRDADRADVEAFLAKYPAPAAE